MIAWAIGLCALIITVAEHSARINASSLAVIVIMLVFYALALACQVALQRLQMAAFREQLAREALQYDALDAASSGCRPCTVALTPTTFSTPPTPTSARQPSFPALDELSDFHFSNDESGTAPPPPPEGLTPSPASSMPAQLAQQRALSQAHIAFPRYASLLHRPLSQCGPFQPYCTPSLASLRHSNSGAAEDCRLDPADDQQGDGTDDRSVDSTISSITMGSALGSLFYTRDGEVIVGSKDIKSIKPRFAGF